MTHGAFEKYDTDLNEYGIEVQNKSRTTNSMIPMSAQQAFQGRLTDLANGIVSRLVSPQCAALLGGGSVWHTACARINHTNTWEHVHIRVKRTLLSVCGACRQQQINNWNRHSNSLGCTEPGDAHRRPFRASLHTRPCFVSHTRQPSTHPCPMCVPPPACTSRESRQLVPAPTLRGAAPCSTCAPPLACACHEPRQLCSPGSTLRLSGCLAATTFRWKFDQWYDRGIMRQVDLTCG